MPCCGRTPWDVPNTDMITTYPVLVTCHAGVDTGQAGVYTQPVSLNQPKET
jgi:hypothetical protein